MTLQLQEYLLILIDFNLYNFGRLTKVAQLHIFLPEFVLFSGVIFLILVIGLNYQSMSTLELSQKLNAFSYRSLYISLLILGWSWISIVYDTSFTNIDWYQGVTLFQNTLKFDIYSQSLKLLILSTSIVLYSYISSVAESKYKQNLIELSLLLQVSIGLCFIIISSSHFAVLLLALEGFSLILYILTTIDRSHGGVIAAVKYFSFGTLGSVLLFWGVVHIYAIIPSLSFNVIRFIFEFSEIRVLNSLEFCSFVILIGFLIKLGAAPFHQWVPDVYAGAHLFVTAVFSTIVKLVIFMILYKIAYMVNIGPIIDFVAIFSLIVGTFITLKQFEIKRFLAYSSITHVGFLLIGDMPSSVVYLVTYLCSSLLIFSVLLTVQNYNKELLYLTDLRLIKKKGQWNTLLLIISLASMAGLPPFSGFFGKFLIWLSLLEDIYLINDYPSYILLLLSVSVTLITIFYYMRLIMYVYVGSDYENVGNAPDVILYNEFSIIQQQALLGFLVVCWILLQPWVMTLALSISYCAIL